MVVKRKCNIPKSLNKQTQKTHQGKMRIKRNKEEVSVLPLRDAEQAFSVGKNKWFRMGGKEYEATGSTKTKRNNYNLKRIQKLEEEIKEKEQLIMVNKGLSNSLRSQTD